MPVFTVLNPATEQPVAEVEQTSAAAADDAIARAVAVQPAWRKVAPGERTALTAIRIAELALEAGLPEGVFQVLPGKGSVVGQRLVDHPDVRKIVFTGSSEVGRQIMAGCARQVKRLTMELGGKSANIVFADSDLERAAATAPAAAFDNAGQDCCARSRILVQRDVYGRLGLEQGRGPGQPGGAGGGVRQPVGQLALLGPLLDPVRRLQAVRARARAGPGRPRRVHRDQERLHRNRRVGAGGLTTQGDQRLCNACWTGSPWSPEPGAASGWPACGALPPKGPGWSRSTSTA